MHRIFIGPAREAKIDLTYHVGRIKRGQKIQVTPKEAEAMDKLPKSWAVPMEVRPVADDVTVTKIVKNRRKRKSRKSRKKGE